MTKLQYLIVSMVLITVSGGICSLSICLLDFAYTGGICCISKYV